MQVSESQQDVATTPATPYFPNLDGLRTIACLLVFMQHGFGPLVGLFADDAGVFSFPLRRLFAAGDLGVSFFFVLSGFLITYLILDEVRQTGNLNVIAFWIRRCLRIWPLYYFVIFFSVVLYPMMKSRIGFGEYIEIGNPTLYFMFLGNFDVITLGQGHGAMSTNITWSVAIEEQFYLVWPLFFILVPKRAYILVFLAIITASTVFRIYNSDDGMVLYFHTLSVISDMAVGGLAAYLSLRGKEFVALATRVTTWQLAVAYVAGILFVLNSHAFFVGSVLTGLDRLVCSLFFVFVILEQNYCGNSLMKMSRDSFKTVVKPYG